MPHKTAPHGMAAIDYRAVLKTIPIAKRQELMTLTNRHGLVTLTLHLTLILLFAMGQSYTTGILSALMLIGQGISMCFLFCAMHEASHNTAFKTKWLNRCVTNGVGFLLFMGSRWFTYFHACHHRYTHDPERDPELLTPKPHDWKSYLVYLSGVMIWWSALKSLVKNAAGQISDNYIPASGRALVVREARIMLGTYTIVIGTLLLVTPANLLWFWVLPLLCGQPFLRLFLLAEHTNCPYESNMLANSRTIYTNRFLLFLSWQMSYHTAHHSFPAVPFHKLEQFHHLIKVHVQQTSQGYGDFHRQIMKQFYR